MASNTGKTNKAGKMGQVEEFIGDTSYRRARSVGDKMEDDMSKRQTGNSGQVKDSSGVTSDRRSVADDLEEQISNLQLDVSSDGRSLELSRWVEFEAQIDGKQRTVFKPMRLGTIVFIPSDEQYCFTLEEGVEEESFGDAKMWLELSAFLKGLTISYEWKLKPLLDSLKDQQVQMEA